MKNIVRATFLNWHLAFDTTITYFLAIYFAHIQRFDLAAGVAATDSMLKLILTMPCAALSTRLDLPARLHLCLFLRPMLALFWLLSFSLYSANVGITPTIIAFTLFKLISIIDAASSSDFSFLAKDSFGIDLSQNNSIQNIISRASVAVAPAFAIFIINNKLNIIYTIGATTAIATIGTITLSSITKTSKHRSCDPSTTTTESTPSPSFLDIFHNPHMRWGFLYQVFVNLSFGGVTYLLIINISKDMNSTINDLSILYLFFFLYSLAIALRGDCAVPARRLGNVTQVISSTAALCIALSISRSHSINLILCGAMGLLYAYELAAIQKLLIPKLRGSGYIRYSALSKTGGRAASASGVALLGMGIESGIPSASLLLVCGLSGLCCAFVLFVSNPERRYALSPLG